MLEEVKVKKIIIILFDGIYVPNLISLRIIQLRARYQYDIVNFPTHFAY